MASPQDQDFPASPEELERERAPTSNPEKGSDEPLSQAVSASSTESRGNSRDADVEQGAKGATALWRREGLLSRFNPIRRIYRAPPVPEERTASREKKAGLLSKLTFQWMSPLMTVCCFLLGLVIQC